MRLPHNPLARLAESATRAAGVNATGIGTATTQQSGSNLNVGANDPTTGIWQPYGIVGITPNDSFMVPGR